MCSIDEGLHFAMGLVDKAALEGYWQHFWLAETPGSNLVVPINRFHLILTFLHIANHDNLIPHGEPGYDDIFKLSPIMFGLVTMCATLFMPPKELSLDELTVAFKGRYTLTFYNISRPDKYEYKAYVLSDADNGYVHKWNLHVGASEDPDNLDGTHVNVRLLLRPEHIGKYTWAATILVQCWLRSCLKMRPGCVEL